MGYPSFNTGDVLAAADMNAVGLWRITTCTVSSTGGTAATASNGVITVGTNNTAVTVNNAFSADFDSYKIHYSGGTGSTLQDLTMTLGSTTSDYRWADFSIGYAGGTSNTGSGLVSTQYWRVGKYTTNGAIIDMTIHNPFLSTRTFFSAAAGFADTTASFVINGGFLNNTTSYTSFTITPLSGNLTGGKIRVYGFRN